MIVALQRAFLVVWRRVPRLARRWIVRFAAPSYTVGAACVIERGDGAILLVRLAYREGWGLPGGLIKRNEDVADCARREVAEEIGVDLTGVPLAYAASEFFVTDDGDPVINVVFAAPIPPDAQPVAASPAEVAGFVWLTLAEAEADPACPAYVLSSLRAAAAV